MIKLSLYYAAATIILAFVDAIRIKIAYGKKENIDHGISDALAIIIAAYIGVWCLLPEVHLGFLWLLPKSIIYCATFVSIRLFLYDIVLNVFRIVTKTNPTLRLDYVSTKTTSYEDQHSNKLGFWQKRALSVAAFGVLLFINYLITKS